MDEDEDDLRARAREEIEQLDQERRRQLRLVRASFVEYLRGILRKLGIAVAKLESLASRLADEFEPFL